MPYPEDLSDLSLSFWERALSEDVCNYMTEFVRLGQNSSLWKKAQTRDFENYCGMFIRMLGTVYDNLKASGHVSISGFVCQPFYFGEHPDLSWLEGELQEGLRTLIYDEKASGNLRTIRVLRYYSDNVLLIIKPNQLRYWIRSTAIRDADETLVNLREQGY